MASPSLTESKAIRRNTLRLIILRFAGVVGGFLVVILHASALTRGKSGISFRQGLAESAMLFFFLGVVVILNLVCLAIYRHVRSPQRFVFSQLFTDIFLLGILIYLTGGPGSLFTHINFAVILAASLLGRGRSSLVCAGLSSLLLAANVLLFAVLPQESLPGVSASWYVERAVDINYFISYLVIPVFAFFVVAILSNILAVRLGTLRLVNDRVLRTMAEAVIICDKAHRVLLFNDEARSLFGFPTSRQLEGEMVEEVFKRDTDDEMVAILTSPEDIHREIGLVKRNGEVQALEAKTAVITSYQDEPIAIVCLFSDLTLRRIADEANRKIQRLEGIRQMSTGIATELRQPLDALQTAISDLKSLTPGNRLINATLTDIRNDLERLDRIASEFLDFSKRGELNFIETDLVKLIQQAGLSEKAKFSAVARLEIQYDLPVSLLCECDPSQMSRVISHLYENALEAMPEGGRLLVRGSYQDRESGSTGGAIKGVSIEFYDEGVGIAPEVQDKIFDPFYGTKRKGAGLGLSVANRIVRAHGGEITFESRVGYGTTFMVWIPATPRPQAPGTSSVPAAAAPPSPEETVA